MSRNPSIPALKIGASFKISLHNIAVFLKLSTWVVYLNNTNHLIRQIGVKFIESVKFFFLSGMLGIEIGNTFLYYFFFRSNIVCGIK